MTCAKSYTMVLIAIAICVATHSAETGQKECPQFQLTTDDCRRLSSELISSEVYEEQCFTVPHMYFSEVIIHSCNETCSSQHLPSYFMCVDLCGCVPKHAVHNEQAPATALALSDTTLVYSDTMPTLAFSTQAVLASMIIVTAAMVLSLFISYKFCGFRRASESGYKKYDRSIESGLEDEKEFTVEKTHFQA